jgi:hypothetical protein
MATWTYEFPFLPDLDLTHNARKRKKISPRDYAYISRTQKDNWSLIFKAWNIEPMTTRVSIEWTLYFKDWKAAFDPDNTSLALKPALDALKLSGIIKDDSGIYISRISFGVEVDKSRWNRTTLRIVDEQNP